MLFIQFQQWLKIATSTTIEQLLPQIVFTSLGDDSEAQGLLTKWLRYIISKDTFLELSLYLWAYTI